MEAEEDLLNLSTAAAASSTASTSSSPPRRPICTNCTRPNPVCLCSSLPTQPIPTQTHIIILHHPHESHHKLSTTPLLTKSLLNTTTIINRRLRPNLSPLLDQSPPAIYLFPPTPSSPAVKLSHFKKPSTPLVLIVFDGTWKHAKEMVKASEGFLDKFATRVCLDDYDENVEGGSIYDSELILRKEPFGGCVSTIEAVARCLRVIEPNRVEIERVLIGVLRDLVRLQAGFLKPVKPRVKLLKKGKEGKRETENEKSESVFF